MWEGMEAGIVAGVRTSRSTEFTHYQTPEDQRGPLWWLDEQYHAERAVTTAAGMVDMAQSDTARYLANRLLDQRLDHLERVEDIIDAVLEDLSQTEPSWLVEACRRRYLKGEAWATVAAGVGMSPSVLQGKCRRAVDAIRHIRSGQPTHQ